MSEFISSLILPAIILLAGSFMFFSKKDYFGAFCSGAKDGLSTSVKLLPSLCAIMVALKMFSVSGAVELFTGFLAPIGEKIGVPAEIFPLLITRPVSGSASNGAFAELIERFGPDSFPSLCAAILMGSSDTMIYVIAVYFSGTGVRHTRHTFPVAIAVMLFCIFLSCFICRVFFT
ncbi:MAG: spore maturation protein [Ruminococcaceae bacterium]|nr:spore maturation protein [Oscillospiraceae bacterium]MBE6708186.1 spore maturation protein [Oscillospiraceae bacterium]